MPNRQKEKGNRFEYKMRDLARSKGLTVKKIPSSGAGADYKGDLEIEGFPYECKHRKDGFREIYKWLGKNRGLFITADHRESLLVIRADHALDMVALWFGRIPEDAA